MFSGAEVSLLLQKFLDALIFFSCKFLRADLALGQIREDGSQRLLLQDGVPFHLVVRDKDRTAFVSLYLVPLRLGQGIRVLLKQFLPLLHVHLRAQLQKSRRSLFDFLAVAGHNGPAKRLRR